MTPAPAIPADGRRFASRIVGSEFFVLYLGLLTFAVLAPIAPGFATPENGWNIVIASLPLLVLAAGQTVVLITAGIDLSATAIIGLTSILGALVMAGDHGWLRGQGFATPAAIATMLGTGAVFGLFNGVCIAFLRMPAFMVTLTSLMFCHGFAVWLAKRFADAESIHQLPPSFLAIGGQPWIGLVLAILATLFAHLLLARTLLGRWLYAVGHNPRTSLLSGVPVAGVTVAAYVLSGLFAGVASILLTARLETASPNHGRALLLDVIGAAVIGGTSLTGGKGRIACTVFGVFFLSLLGNGLNLLNLSDFLITIVKGAVILVAALLDVWRTGRMRSA